jgi:hypothetical protein
MENAMKAVRGGKMGSRRVPGTFDVLTDGGTLSTP